MRMPKPYALSIAWQGCWESETRYPKSQGRKSKLSVRERINHMNTPEKWPIGETNHSFGFRAFGFRLSDFHLFVALFFALGPLRIQCQSTRRRVAAVLLKRSEMRRASTQVI